MQPTFVGATRFVGVSSSVEILSRHPPQTMGNRLVFESVVKKKNGLRRDHYFTWPCLSLLQEASEATVSIARTDLILPGPLDMLKITSAEDATLMDPVLTQNQTTAHPKCQLLLEHH